MTQIEKSLDHFFQRLGHTPGPWMNPPADNEVMTVPNGQIKIARVYQAYEFATQFNAKLITQSPEMLHTICRTYLWMLANVKYRGTLTVDQTLADLRNQISEATGIACQEVQDTFEQYCLWIQVNQEIPKIGREELADQRDPETKIFNAMENGAEDWDDRP